MLIGISLKEDFFISAISGGYASFVLVRSETVVHNTDKLASLLLAGRDHVNVFVDSVSKLSF